MSETQKRIVVVDDEPDLREILEFNLMAEGFDVQTAASAEEALTLPLQEADIMLLDVMMDGMSGFQLAKRLKDSPLTSKLPIIFLTARDTENDTVTGFNLGADDYITKPYSIREVVLRVKAVLRRTALAQAAAAQNEEPEEAANIVMQSGIRINTDMKTVEVDGNEVSMSPTEYKLLLLLLSNPGHVYSRDELIERVWPSDAIVIARTVDVCITRLRKKIAPYSSHIVTRQSFGYCFKP